MKVGKKRERWQKISAWMLALVMVLGLVMVPAGTVEAAGIELKYTSGEQISTPSADDKGNYNTDINLGNGGYSSISALKDAGITTLRVTYKIVEAAATGTLAVQPYINAKDNWKGNWTAANADGKEHTVELNLSQYYSVSAELWNFGIQFCNASSITYEITEAYLVKSEGSGSTSGDGTTGGTTDFGVTRDYSTGVSATLTNQKAPSNDWSSFDMKIENNSGTTICDWIVKLKVPSGTASAFKCWNAVFVADGDTIYMYPMQSGANAVLGTGVMDERIPGGGFSSKYVDASNIKVEAVYYNKGESSGYDYSSGDTNDETGGTGGSGNGGNSATDTSTNKDLDVEYNYAKLLQESLYFYDANMCGNLEGKCGIGWRANCHMDDANVSTTINGVTYNVDVSGGFHDAGDHVKFGLPQGYAATMLGMSYYQFPDAYTSNGLTSHLQTITDYFCDYFKRCTVYDTSGKVVGFCYQVGEGGPDHGYWGPPESQPKSNRGGAYFATSSNPATDEVSVAIAALAMNYINFGNEEDLQTAKDLFTFASSVDKRACATEGTGGFYDSDSWQDDYGLAAAALYVATKDSSYQSEYTSQGYVNSGWVLDWSNTGALACMLMNDTSKLSGVVNAGKNCSTIDNLFSCLLDWGSCRYNAASEFVGLVYDKLSNTKTYDSWAVSQMNYMIGDNPNKRCYIVGYNENSSQYPHHRAASRSSDAGTTNPEHYILLGALVGGPGKNGVYVDNQNNYECNEVALDYSAGLVGAAAGLYCAHKEDTSTYLSYAKETTTNYSTALATEDELSAIGVTKCYGAPSADPGKVTGVKLDKTTLSLSKGESAALTATVSPETATNTSVTWSSSDTKIATVDKDGKVTAVAAGTATITVKTTDGEKTATCKVTVTAPGITLDKETLTLKVRASETLEATVTGVTDKTVAWSSSDEKVATVDKNGKVTAVAEGAAEIIATVGSGANAVKAACAVTVTKNTPKVTVPEDITVEAGTKLSDIVFDKTEFTADVEGTFAWKTTDKTLTEKDNNSNAVVTFTPEDEAAYSSVDKEITILVTKKKYASAPAAPELSNVTKDTVTLKEVDQTTAPVQYGLKQGADFKWQDTNVFTGFSEYTTHEFALRYIETDIYEASEAGETLKVTTLFNDANKYKIDLAKLTEENYVEAHGGTITYDAKTKVLTLTESKIVYTITGSNEGVEIRCADGVIARLKGAGCKSISGDGDLTVQLENKSEVAEGINAERSITIQNGTTGVGSVKVFSGENNAAITAPDVTIEGGQITATGTGEQKAIEAITDNGSGILKLFGGIVTANAENKPPIEADKIILDGGQVSSDSSPIYSTDPVDKEENSVSLCSVTYVNGTESTTTSMKQGSEITLPPLPAKTGYKANGWKLADKVYVPGETKTISEKVTFTADYTEITGDLEVSVSDVEDLIAGYEADSGVKVTITNGTTVTIDEIALVLSNGKEFTISKENITGLEIEESVEVTVTLKNGFGVGSYETDLTVTCVEGEYEKVTKSITRVVGKASVPKPENAPEILSVTKNSVTLVPVTGKTVQYGIKQTDDDSYTWQASNKFTNLKSYTTYSFAIRYAETASTNASEASESVTATTLMDENGKYTVDLIKLDDKKYVDAHDGSISYDATKKELTLLEGKTYTITGENPNLTIQAKENVTIILDNATVAAIKGDKNVTIQLKGTSKILSETEDISAVEAAGTVTISKAENAQTGSVTIQGGAGASGIEADKVIIKDGTVTVTGGSEAGGIKADNVVIEDGTVTVTGGAGAAGVEAKEEVTITGGTVTVTGGAGNTAGIKADKVTITGGTGSVTGQGNKPAIDANSKDISESIEVKNGSSYKDPEESGESKDPDKKDEKKLVESIKVTISATSIMENKTATAVAEVLPADAADKTVTWSSSNPSVATVSQNGVVTAVLAGTADIIATAKDGSGKSGKVTITVVDDGQGDDDKTVKATAMTITADVKGASDVPVKNTFKLAPKKKMELNVVLSPEDAVEEDLTFTSSNPKIASVDEDGQITAGKKAGTTVITVTSEGGLKKTFKVQVMKKPVKKVKIKASKKAVKVNKKLKLKAALTPNKKQASDSVYWKSSNTKVAVVSDTGVVKGMKKGKAKITAVATDGSGKKATVTIQVK